MDDPAADDFIEDEKDLEVRKWLVNLGAEEIQWLSMFDRYGITLDGIQPRLTNVKFGHSTGQEILDRIAKTRRDKVYSANGHFPSTELAGNKQK